MFVVIVFSILLFRLYEQKKVANIILAAQKEEILEKNEELNMQKEEILTQRDNLQLLNLELMQQKEEITAQRDEISIQSKIIEKHNKKITSSIVYAQRIQKATLPSEAKIKKFFPQHFIIFKPKDLVSGDFYWFEEKKDKIYFAAVDCTGHGVPGGFMSMLSYNLLNEAINDKSIIKPFEIINHISLKLNKILRQGADDDSVKDGFDLALCCYNPELMMLEYAGVQSSIYHISNNLIKEYNSDWLPIGEPFQENFNSYSNIEIQLKQGDIVYMTTDGYTDQFSGDLLKKYSNKRLKETVLSIHQLSMAIQKEILETEFNTWKGSYEQIDDILLIGIRV